MKSKEILENAIKTDFPKLKRDYPLMDSYPKRIRFTAERLFLTAAYEPHLTHVATLTANDIAADALIQSYRAAFCEVQSYEKLLYLPPERREEIIPEDIQALVANDNHQGLQNLIDHIAYTPNSIKHINHALCLAAGSGAIQCLQLLLGARPIANILAPDVSEKIALYHAIDKGQLKALSILLTALTPEGNLALTQQFLFGARPYRPIDRIQHLENPRVKEEIIMIIRSLLNEEHNSISQADTRLILSLLPLSRTAPFYQSQNRVEPHETSSYQPSA